MYFKYDNKNLNYRKVSFWPWIIIGICAIIILSLRKADEGGDFNPFQFETELMILQMEGESKISDNRLMETLLYSGIKFPDIVFAQACIESAHFTSPLFREGNNLFGMKVPRSRPTTSTYVVRGYAGFDTWKQSVIDYALYQSAYMRKINNRDQYLDYLGERYAEDPGYVSKVEKLSKEIKIKFDL